MQRIVVARGARVLHDLGALEVVDDAGGVGLANLQVRGFEGHDDQASCFWSTGRSVRTPTPRAVITSSPFWSRYSVTDSEKTSFPELHPSQSQVLPGLVMAVSTSPGLMCRWYS